MGSENGTQNPCGDLKPEELRIIRRLRTLQSGVHMVIIQVDAQGLLNMTLLESGKLERLRKDADLV